MLGIRGRLHCRRHINKMFYFPPSAVCVKTAPALPCSCALPPRPPLHRRLPHFSLLLLTFSFAWRYKGCGNKAGLHHRSIKDERSGRRKPESVFSFLVFFSVSVLRALWIVAPRRAGLLECHSEWTQELWGLFPHFEGKLVKKKKKKKTVLLDCPYWELLLLQPLFFFLFWKHVDGGSNWGDQRTHETKDVGSFCSIKTPSPPRKFKDKHQRRFHVVLLADYLKTHS